jgi:hypothetical protein
MMAFSLGAHRLVVVGGTKVQILKFLVPSEPEDTL